MAAIVRNRYAIAIQLLHCIELRSKMMLISDLIQQFKDAIDRRNAYLEMPDDLYGGDAEPASKAYWGDIATCDTLFASMSWREEDVNFWIRSSHCVVLMNTAGLNFWLPLFCAHSLTSDGFVIAIFGELFYGFVRPRKYPDNITITTQGILEYVASHPEAVNSSREVDLTIVYHRLSATNASLLVSYLVIVEAICIRDQLNDLADEIQRVLNAIEVSM